MKVVDTNVLIYATFNDLSHHDAAARWLTSAVSGGDSIGLPWVSILAFVRLTTNRRVFAQPLTTAQAIDLVRVWLSRPNVIVLEPTQRHLDVLAGLLPHAGAGGDLTMDAHVAALAVEYGGEVVSFDRDFGRFGVRVSVPE